MDCTVSCRGIPLLKVPAVAGGKETVAVAVHQLSIHLWKSFDTPRASVQRKIEELRIPLIQCSKAQLKHLREKGVVSGFRATLVSLQDAERVCDALKHSRDKRGLSKHPIKAKLGRRAEEKSLIKMKARETNDNGLLTAVKEDVDGCALIGGTTTPTTDAASDSSSDSPPQLIFDLLLVAEEEDRNRLIDLFENEVRTALNDCTSVESYLSHAQTLEALDLSVAGSQRMASLRNHVGRPKKINGKSSSISNLCLSSTRDKPHPLISPIRTAAHPSRTASHPPSTRGSKEGSCITPMNGRDYRSGLRSPVLATEGEVLVNGGGAEICRRSEQGSKRNGRFLFLSSEEEEEEEEDVVVLKVERNTRFNNGSCLEENGVAVVEPKATRPYPRRVIATKLRLFAHTTSPTAAAAASPGKQLPFGSSHSSPRHQTKTLVVSISRSLLNSASSTAKAPSIPSSAPPSGHTGTQPRKRGRPPSNKSRPKPSLSSFATMKRARVQSPPPPPPPPPAVAAGEAPPTKRQKVNSSEMQHHSKSADSAAAVPKPKKKPNSLEALLLSEPGSKVTKESPDSEMASRSRGGGGALKGVAVGGVASSSVALGGKSYKPQLSGEEGEERTSAVISEVCNRLHGIKQRGPKSGSEAHSKPAVPENTSTINFDELFNYYPPKLIVQDGDLCPEHSLSVSGIERSKLSPTHPFWSWTMGQPISKPPAPTVKATRRKLKSKAMN